MKSSTQKITITLINTLLGLTGLSLAVLSPGIVQADSSIEINSKVGIEARYFTKDGLDARQNNSNYSIWFQTEIFKQWKDKNLTLTLIPFIRIDQNDKERSHADLREFMFHKNAKSWELKAGIGKVFWGVTESQHLVDIINQSDAIESPDGEEKLGQPMVQLKLKRKSGTYDLFLLPYFRERTFSGVDGRLRSTPYVDTSQTIYESGKEKKHVDYAARWSKTIKIWDVGLSYFSGTSRDPVFLLGTDSSGELALIPRYDQISQTGLDLQATIGKWLWKLEYVHRRARQEKYAAYTAGFEYTQSGFLKTRADVGFLMEYLKDERDNAASLTPFQDDVMLGTRITFNDTASSELLFGIILDSDTDEKSYFVEFARRIKQHYKLSIEARAVSDTDPSAPLYLLRKDNHVQIELIRYF